MGPDDGKIHIEKYAIIGNEWDNHGNNMDGNNDN